jgi:hypothetical protein
MQNKTFEDAVDEILEKIEDKLNDAKQDGGILNDVKTLIMGPKTVQKPEAPAVWIMQGETSITTSTRLTMWESWEMDIVCIGVVYNAEEGATGFKEANSLAARIKRVLMSDRTLGFGHGSFFTDIKSKKFDGNNPYFKNGNLYTAVYTCTVVFTIKE